MLACQETSCRRELCESCDKVFPQEAKRLEAEREAKKDALELKKYRRSLTFKVRARPYMYVCTRSLQLRGHFCDSAITSKWHAARWPNHCPTSGNVQQSPVSKSNAAGHELKN